MLVKDPNRPLRFGGACSTMKVMALCCSLPAEMPCRMRAMTNRIGARYPIVTNPGVRAMISEPRAIPETVSVRTIFRP